MWLLSKYVVIFLCSVKHQRQIQKTCRFSHWVRTAYKFCQTLLTNSSSSHIATTMTISTVKLREKWHISSVIAYIMWFLFLNYSYCIKLKLFFFCTSLLSSPFCFTFFLYAFFIRPPARKRSRSHTRKQTRGKCYISSSSFFFKRNSNSHSFRL